MCQKAHGRQSRQSVDFGRDALRAVPAIARQQADRLCAACGESMRIGNRGRIGQEGGDWREGEDWKEGEDWARWHWHEQQPSAKWLGIGLHGKRQLAQKSCGDKKKKLKSFLTKVITKGSMHKWFSIPTITLGVANNSKRWLTSQVQDLVHNRWNRGRMSGATAVRACFLC